MRLQSIFFYQYMQHCCLHLGACRTKWLKLHLSLQSMINLACQFTHSLIALRARAHNKTEKQLQQRIHTQMKTKLIRVRHTVHPVALVYNGRSQNNIREARWNNEVNNGAKACGGRGEGGSQKTLGSHETFRIDAYSHNIDYVRHNPTSSLRQVYMDMWFCYTCYWLR